VTWTIFLLKLFQIVVTNILSVVTLEISRPRLVVSSGEETSLRPPQNQKICRRADVFVFCGPSRDAIRTSLTELRDGSSKYAQEQHCGTLKDLAKYLKKFVKRDSTRMSLLPIDAHLMQKIEKKPNPSHFKPGNTEWKKHYAADDPRISP
jgi:hypothetical protein